MRRTRRLRKMRRSRRVWETHRPVRPFCLRSRKVSGVIRYQVLATLPKFGRLLKLLYRSLIKYSVLASDYEELFTKYFKSENDVFACASS